MEAQEKENLLAYLKDAISLECDVLKQNSIINNFTQTALSRKPELIEREKPHRPQQYNVRVDESARIKGIGFIVAAIAVFVFGIFIFGIEPSGSYNYSSRKYEVNSISQGLITIGGLMFIGSAIWLLKIGYKDFLSPYFKGKNQNDQLLTQYNQQINDYNEACAETEQYNAQKRAEYTSSL